MTPRPALILSAWLAAAPACAAPALVLAPPTGSGRAGEVLRVTGSGFTPSASVFLQIGGVDVVTGDPVTDAAGNLAPTLVLLTRALPAGKHDAAVVAGVTATFKAAYQVRPVV